VPPPPPPRRSQALAGGRRPRPPAAPAAPGPAVLGPARIPGRTFDRTFDPVPDRALDSDRSPTAGEEGPGGSERHHHAGAGAAATGCRVEFSKTRMMMMPWVSGARSAREAASERCVASCRCTGLWVSWYRQAADRPGIKMGGG
jgi:hypothetical protein